MNDVVSRALYQARVAGQRRLERQLTVERIFAMMVADGFSVPTESLGGTAAIWLAHQNHAPAPMLEMVAGAMVARLPSAAAHSTWATLPPVERALALMLAGASAGFLLDPDDPEVDGLLHLGRVTDPDIARDELALMDRAFGDSSRRMLWPTVKSCPPRVRLAAPDGFLRATRVLELGMSTRLSVFDSGARGLAVTP